MTNNIIYSWNSGLFVQDHTTGGVHVTTPNAINQGGYRRCPRILDAITIVRPEIIVRWHRMGFAAYWRWKSRPLGGRPRIRKEVRDPSEE
jgi:hypothetical protein